MIKETEVLVNGHPSNYSYYKKLGYDIEIHKPIFIKTSDLMRGSSVKITTICSVCGRESINTFKDYYNYTNGLVDNFYCIKCKTIKSENTCLEKWGVKNPMCSDLVKETLRNSLIDKYGVDHYSKTDEFKIKFKNTCIEKYGVDNPFKNEEIKNEIKKSLYNNYGVYYPMQSQLIRDKSSYTCINKYGFNAYSKTDEFKSKVSSTNIIKTGVDNPMKLEYIKNKVRETNISKYGVDHISKTDEFKLSIKTNREINTLDRYIKLISSEYDIKSYSGEDFVILHKKCNNIFNINRSLLRARINLSVCVCPNCNPVGIQYSSIESELIDFLDDNNILYIRNDRKLLNGKELDIYIPDYKLAIEVNGLYWHSELYKNKSYHIEKTNRCNDIGIELFHIWEDDWKNKKNIILSILRNKMSLIKKKIYARKCEIMNVGSKQSRIFLDNNHIQGFCASSIKIGLFYNNELVSLMTFGFRYTNGKKEFELIRFCNKINTSVVGAASKLFNHINKIMKINEIVSYSDISIFNGGLYNLLGFRNISRSNPNYFWVVDGVKRHRFNYQKKKLVNHGYDKSMTEVEIMHSLGYYRVFSCGQEKWVFNN